MNLLPLLQQKLHHALSGLVPDPAPFAEMLRPTQDARFGDYQANCAMSLAKTLGKKPRDLAQEIVQRLELGDLLQPPEVAGPGFINLRLRPEWLAAQIQQLGKDDRLGIAPAATPRTFVIDFSSPNVAKPMHVGHLRSTIIGDALTRILRFLGHRVITDNHLGDWGTQFGMLLYGYKHFRNDEAYQQSAVRELARLYIEVRKLAETFANLQTGYEKAADRRAFQSDPIGELARAYAKVLARKRSKADEDEEDEGPNPIADAYRQETARLHAGDSENLALWRQFMPLCLEDIERIYRRLDIRFDAVLGESYYNAILPEVVKSLLESGIASESEGAVIISFGEGEPPALIRKRDGAFTYTTTDLATIRHRVGTWNPDAILYVVDFRQSFHFKTLFDAARRWGYDKVEFQHISFGSVLGKDRRPIKTREGGGVELSALLDEAADQADRIYLKTVIERLRKGEEVPELSTEERQQLAEVIGLGAVKYADLSQNRTSDYVFSWDKMLAMDGNTATYMQYAYVRNRGIFRKGAIDVARLSADPPAVLLDDPAERGLALELLRFGEALATAATEYKPSAITSYLWDLAKSYSTFFQNCPVLKAPTPALRDSRLLLCDLTARMIQKGLNLLGIGTVERM